MRILHGWDCPCGTRNAPVFTHCRRCAAPILEGYPVMVEEAPLIVAPPPRRRGHSTSLRARRRMGSEVSGCLWKMGFAVGIPVLAYFCFDIPLWVWPVLIGAAVFCTPWYFWAAYLGLKELSSISRNTRHLENLDRFNR